MSSPLRVTHPSPAATTSYAGSLSQSVLVVGSSALALRARSAFRGRASIDHAPTSRAAREILRRQSLYAMLVEPVDQSALVLDVFVSESRRHFPRTPIIVCVSSRRSMSSEALALVRSGANDLIGIDELELPHTARRVIEAARLGCLGDVIWPSIEPLVDPILAPCMRLALRLAFRPLDVERIARDLGVTRKTLWQRCQNKHALSPRELLGWCRVLAVAFALEDLGRSVDSIAVELEFPSPSAMRNLLQRYVGLTATELRSHGASAFVVAKLLGILGDGSRD
jgi:AraC-like DNA-binding protein